MQTEMESTIRARGRPRRLPGQPVHRRPSEQIRKIEVRNLDNALAFARDELALPPNIHVTVHWARIGGDLDPPARISRLLNRMSTWLSRRRGPTGFKLPTVWAYARETASAKGEHLHLLVHVPHTMAATKNGIAELTTLFEGWVSRDGPLQDIPGSKAVKVTEAVKPFRQRDLRNYLLKGAPAETLEQCGIATRHRDKGSGHVILGKRVKVSRAIDTGARTAHYASLGPRVLGDEHWRDDIDPARTHKPHGKPLGAANASVADIGTKTTQNPPTGFSGASMGPSKVDPH